ncbi:DEAD/DEAH box helicase [Cellulomonas humilata]|uniref:AAA family ATPase n=1 Tax=Cellulomonas humilata TaxID=144055 RepID=A0ABU0EL16_9CELL|nr:ATP-binding protein [Cellulomonas humilata]MDQ0375991.1 hypothetical protein [Cellulomonas humilata]
MKFQDIPAPLCTARVAPVAGEELAEGPVLSVSPVEEHPGEFELRTQTGLVRVTPTHDADVHVLNGELATGRTVLAHLFSPAPDGTAELHLKLFAGAQHEMGRLEIGVDERVLKAGKKLVAIRSPSDAQVCDELWHRSTYTVGTRSYFFLTAGEAAKEDLEGVTTRRAFALQGDGVRFAVEEYIRPDSATIFLASKLTPRRTTDPAVRLARGTLKLLDWTAAGALGVLASAELTELIASEGSYLKKWDEYGAIEGDIFLERARAVGKLRIVSTASTRNGSVEVGAEVLSVEQARALEGITQLELTDELPSYLTNPQLTWSEYSHELSEESRSGGRRAGHETLVVPVESVRGSTVELRLDDPPGHQWLIFPVASEVAQIRRRMDARKRILSGRSANPNLGLLIEEGGQLIPRTKTAPIKPLSSFVRAKVFRNDPTPKQLEAIEVALNTPDIALIQGPPGTGKTTVITAIVERLNELADKRKHNIKGQILMSGYQQDAVENLIGRLTVNSLPTPKFGRRSNEKVDVQSASDRQLEEWCTQVATSLREATPDLAISAEEQRIRTLCIQYIKAPSTVLASSLLAAAAALPLRTLGEDLHARLVAQLQRLTEEQAVASSPETTLRLVRGLRVRPESFADDGPARAYDVRDGLTELLDETQRALLNRAVTWTKVEPPPFLAELNTLKGELLTRLTPAPAFRVEKARDVVVELIRDTLAAIRERGTTAQDGRTAALSEFLHELENNPQGCATSVRDFSLAFAATVQQSVAKSMRDAKGVAANESLTYEWVIVDEAARVGPRDLMIALEQGKRTILVGDHRQLPQLLDQNVADRLEQGDETGNGAEWLKKSMFEYLFAERLKSLEQQDGVVRRVTLDRQYRMHPMLGDFISRTFYESQNPDERFEPGLPASHFTHNLPGTDGRCAAWMNVGGQRTSSGKSAVNIAEAEAIVEKVGAWMDSDAGQDLTFGVISFYRAQADYIRHLLADRHDPKRLLVGTVDSFQGREFDVVFLSVVRSAGAFGFLKLQNRLNVAMSRQKRLLVAVGDSRYFDTPEAARDVPGLHAYLQLCRTQGVVL